MTVDRSEEAVDVCNWLLKFGDERLRPLHPFLN
ncbi:hypothetical protein FF80_03124 [Devosia sp. LC5]|nr:hypothetical protein FF80_03124 [Devosia sp. LC5]